MRIVATATRRPGSCTARSAASFTRLPARTLAVLVACSPLASPAAADGTCTLRRGDHVEWRRKFRAAGPDELVVEKGLRHLLQPDGTLAIEGRYTARR